MTTINPNLRFLRFDEVTYRMKQGLCDSCGVSDGCSIRAGGVQQCTDYQPVISFKSLKGTEGEFNTFRLGGAWFTRVKPGQLIGILNDKCEKVGDALVKAVHCGDKQRMLNDHASMNHLILSRETDEPAVELRRLIRNLYGTNFLAKAELMTVIYLKMQ